MRVLRPKLLGAAGLLLATAPLPAPPASLAIGVAAGGDPSVAIAAARPIAQTAGLRVRLPMASHPANLVLVDLAALQAGCGKTDGTGLRPLAFDMGDPAIADPMACGVAARPEAVVLAWDRRRVPALRGWADLWDVARSPGQRGLQRDPRGTLEIALLADGVAPADLYRVLGTEAGQLRALHRLDQIRPYLVWWNTAQQASALIARHAVLMTSADDFAVQAGPGLGVVRARCLSRQRFWAVPVAAPHADLATRFLRAAVADRAASVEQTETNAGCVPEDAGFWAANDVRLRARFAAWLLR